ncbi:MAG: peptide-methionine (S)-S-oxide reductase MsrA [Sterolibacterium sp.]|nr:peptide-methionine (S)-S-oxide reductase MsrA [Sterolibacterium sp.]
MGNTGKFELATLGGGCFWCLEAIFVRLRGVATTVSGYCGGNAINPSYPAVCEGNTGHAEVVQVKFEPALVSYHKLLEVFFAIHDPTTRNRQGYDIGTQYRSVIFTHSDVQARTAVETIAALNTAHVYNNPIVTEVLASEAFYPAEDYHQSYFSNNTDQPYCQAVVAPKLEMFLKKFGDRNK